MPNGRRITTHEATIRTAHVEVQALTLNGKQMTLSVFRQLQQEDLIDPDTLQLRGIPWGRVNYHPDGCKDEHHLHVVWQRGDELRQAMIPATAPGTVTEDLADDYAEAAALWYRLEAIEGNPPPPWYQGYIHDGAHWSLLWGEVPIAIPISEDLERVWSNHRHYLPSGASATTHPHHQARLQALREALVAEGHGELSCEEAAGHAGAIEVACAQRLRAYQHQYETLMSLDQLFIAV